MAFASAATICGIQEGFDLTTNMQLTDIVQVRLVTSRRTTLIAHQTAGIFPASEQSYHRCIAAMSWSHYQWDCFDHHEQYQCREPEQELFKQQKLAVIEPPSMLSSQATPMMARFHCVFMLCRAPWATAGSSLLCLLWLSTTQPLATTRTLRGCSWTLSTPLVSPTLEASLNVCSVLCR
jgi:hypothetical protein